MLSQKQLETMLTMQNRMNATVKKDWAVQNWDYMRASALEAAEAVEHHGWKWWKAQKMDLPQLQMELVDIWHFYLSRHLQIHTGDVAQALESVSKELKGMADFVMFDGVKYTFSTMTILEKLDVLCGLACAKRMSFALFFSICNDVSLSVKDIYEQYVQKNTLNIFRQAKGYKEGTYHKEWFGEEDNVYLVKIASSLDASNDDYAEKLWAGLEETYTRALAAK